MRVISLTTILPFYLIIVVTLRKVSSSLSYSDKCKTRSLTKVQVAFVIDRTESFEDNLPFVAQAIPKFLDELNKKFPGSQIAITTFGDYTKEQRVKRSAHQEYNASTKCYFMEQQFNSDANLLRKTLKNIKPTKGYKDYEENSLTACLLAASDTSIGWITQDSDNGYNVYRVLFLITDNDALIGKKISFKDASKRHPPIGDGTDNCENSFPADYYVLEKVFAQKKIHIIAAISENGDTSSSSSDSSDTPENIFEIFSKHFNEIEAPYNLIEYEDGKPTDMANEWMGAIYRIVPCKPYPTVQECRDKTSLPRKLQLAFVTDRTASFKEKFFSRFATGSKIIYDKLATRFSEVQFGLTLFTDYTGKQWDHDVSGKVNQFNDSTSCYVIRQTFTNSIESFQSSVRNVVVKKRAGGDESQDQMTAIFLTATDSNLGWSQDSEHLIIMITDSDTHNYKKGQDESGKFLDWKKRHAPKSDGSDTCENSFLPTYKNVGDAALGKNIRIIGLLAPHDGFCMFRKWTMHFNRVGVDYKLVEFETNKIDLVADRIVRASEQVVPCSVVGTPNTTPVSPVEQCTDCETDKNCICPKEKSCFKIDQTKPCDDDEVNDNCFCPPVFNVCFQKINITSC